MALRECDIARLGAGAQRQLLRKLQGAEKQGARGSKYRNTPTEANNIRFASKKEAERYTELTALLAAGKIRNLKLQPQFTLQESYMTPEGERVRAIRYVADFTYERETAPDQNGATYWVTVVEDVKSKATRTQKYEIKRKLLRERLGVRIEEV